jgi:hypothetical protein
MSDSGPRILVVDDERAIRRFGRLALSAQGYSVFEAASGQEAAYLTFFIFTQVSLFVIAGYHGQVSSVKPLFGKLTERTVGMHRFDDPGDFIMQAGTVERTTFIKGNSQSFYKNRVANFDQVNPIGDGLINHRC